MPDYRVLALDIDGTLVDSAGNLPPAHAAAVATARRRGLKVVLVTGRGWGGTRPLYQTLDLTEPAILFSGSQVVDSSGQPTWEQRLDPADTARICAAAEAPPISLVACIDGERSLASRWTDDFDAWDLWAPGVPVVGDLAPHLAQRPPLFLCGYGERAARTLLAAFPDGLPATRFQLYDPRPAETVLFLWHRAADKAAALQRVCATWGIGPTGVVAIGDHPIDLDMLRWAGTGVAVGTAPPAVRQACALVTEPDDPAPVASALRRLGIVD